MNIEVEYLDQHGVISNRNYYISKLGLVKHMAIAGQRYAPTSKKIFKTIGMFLQYSYFLQSNSLNKDKFSLPPHNLYDPTEKGQFSNIAGKGISDFLSKKIDNALHTVNYEAAMRIKKIPIVGGRPDLLAFTNNETFAIEAKGYTKNSVNDMFKHKTQSQTGAIPVNFTVASVSYNLYDKVKCKYHDPYNANIPLDEKLLSEITKKYYSGIIDFLDFADHKEVEYKDESFYEIDILSSNFINTSYNRIFKYFFHDLLHHNQFKLIVPKKITEYSEKGLDSHTEPFLYDSNEKIYIDNDRIGLKIT
ncbi:MAG: hypothetical protein U9O64_11435 [Campylobacterota bacterium]|nr:hypothetical protein [Campylobacterota bacterium]